MPLWQIIVSFNTPILFHPFVFPKCTYCHFSHLSSLPSQQEFLGVEAATGSSGHFTSAWVRALSQKQRYKSWSQPTETEGKAVSPWRFGKMSRKKELEYKANPQRCLLGREADVLWAEPQLGAARRESGTKKRQEGWSNCWSLQALCKIPFIMVMTVTFCRQAQRAFSSMALWQFRQEERGGYWKQIVSDLSPKSRLLFPSRVKIGLYWNPGFRSSLASTHRDEISLSDLSK